MRLTDLRADDRVHTPDDCGLPRAFGEAQRAGGRDAILYRSVRRAGGETVAIYKPRRLLPVTQGDHFAYLWDGGGRVEVVRMTNVR